MAFISRRFTATELPIWEYGERPLWNNQQLKQKPLSPDSGHDTALRVVRCFIDDFLSPPQLDSFLSMTDRHLNIISGCCRTRSLDHTWGLYKFPNNNVARTATGLKLAHFVAYTDLKIPSNYVLAAEVAVLADAQALHPAVQTTIPGIKTQINNGIQEYFDIFSGKHRLNDLRLGQFATHVTPVSGREVTHVDLEPLYAKI